MAIFQGEPGSAGSPWSPPHLPVVEQNLQELMKWGFYEAGCPSYHTNTATTTTVLRPFFRDHLGESVPDENFWTLWCKGEINRRTHRPSGWVPLHPD